MLADLRALITAPRGLMASGYAVLFSLDGIEHIINLGHVKHLLLVDPVVLKHLGGGLSLFFRAHRFMNVGLAICSKCFG